MKCMYRFFGVDVRRCLFFIVGIRNVWIFLVEFSLGFLILILEFRGVIFLVSGIICCSNRIYYDVREV